ncbi:hypothetical protein JZU51_02750 [bacterium]|nr:hypothetical protein [bacterium]
MKTLFFWLLFCLSSTMPLALAQTSGEVETARAFAENATESSGRQVEPDSQAMEKSLQSLHWKQFRSIIEAIPKLKADVEAYGPIGWQFVQGNYKTYGWKKNIDRLDETQKKHLAELIQMAKEAR